jgi:L-histidine Nalpha-methyltransferase
MVCTSVPTIDVLLSPEQLASDLAEDVLAGLTSVPKHLPPKWLYDERGSRLFDAITRLPEYYLTRAERAILAAHAAEIAHLSGASTLIELGSGTSDKTRLLLDALVSSGRLRRFVALDVAEPTLRGALEALAGQYPAVEMAGVVGDFERHLAGIPCPIDGDDKRMVAFLGGTVGNLEDGPRAAFLADLAAQLLAGEWLLLGADLVKDATRLIAAYDDAAGVTAEFERNVLSVVNHALGADFDPARFEYVARWDPKRSHVAMGLRSRGEQEVRIPVLDLAVRFDDGEELATETSAKFRRDQLRAELERAGFSRVSSWLDPDGDFIVTLAQRRAS